MKHITAIVLSVLMSMPIAALASGRFAGNNDGTVSDIRTGLVWLKSANACGLKTWAEAAAYCARLKSGMAGLKDGSTAGQWRLPGKAELEGIGTDPPATWESGYPAASWEKPGVPFTGVQSFYYWAATRYPDSTAGAWFVNMCNGIVDYTDNGNNGYASVWPVRGPN